MTDITAKELFDLAQVDFADLFVPSDYPWKVLPRIKEYILSFNNSEYTEIKEGVFVGKNVRIHPSAVIEAPAIIGEGTEIRPGAYLRGSVITGRFCVIGNSTEVKNSVIFNRVQIPHYNYVGDSVLGNFSHLGAGSICSNLKNDSSNITVHADTDINTDLKKIGAILADGANVGCNCVLNPGTVIGKNTSVYPMTAVRGVIHPEMIVKSMENIVKKAK